MMCEICNALSSTPACAYFDLLTLRKPRVLFFVDGSLRARDIRVV